MPSHRNDKRRLTAKERAKAAYTAYLRNPTDAVGIFERALQAHASAALRRRTRRGR